MIGAIRTPAQQQVTVFGGSGFLGRFVVQALAKRGYRIKVATRRPDLANYLQPLGTVGQITVVQANLRDAASVARAVANADHVVNLVGILQEGGRQRFDTLQAQGPRLIAQSAPAKANIVHISAIGADAQSESAYARSKAAGEAGLFEVRPDAIVVRPSLMFGPGDNFFNRFAALARMLPVLPLAGADTRFQPVYAGDVAELIVRAVDGAVPAGKIYECGGPEVRTLQQLVQYVLEVTERKRFIVPLPSPVGRAQGTLMGFLDKISLGLLPREFAMTRDQAILLEKDNVVSEGAIREGRTLEAQGVTPTTIEAIAPAYLIRFRKTGQFDLKRASGSKA
ncbi:complex I NDUFA9 subunit family protein [Microvirga terricola]|uniref:Complex I NDUFA9 subunit family protein n=1 Tax=Microvirga terricola TaxID=2719797 RepID=A0ABX0V715_9HYPH|nr:complex I NDUFA9 subunit family protein [Microvirga terricola]NIX75640.1 complex I NDUFA9 subunit family protein [Microvirga terricola]